MEDDSLILKKKQADKLFSDIEKKHSKIIEIKNNCDLLLKEIQSTSSNNKRIENSLASIKRTSDQIFEDINKKKAEISNQFNSTNLFYEKRYLPLLRKIDHPETGFSIKVEQTNAHFKEIEKTSISVAKHYEEIKKNVKEYGRIVHSLKGLESSTQKIYDFISDKKPKIEDILSNVIETERNVKTSYSEIRKLLSSSINDNENISELKFKSNNDYDRISLNKDESEKLLHSIQEIYEIAAETGLSGEFENRRNKLKDELIKWEKRLFQVSLTLLGSLFGLFFYQLYLYDWDIKGHNFDVNFYVRFLILSPIVYYLIFCAGQHDKTKKLHDKYSFKTTLAMSIKSHIELLLTNKSFQTQERVDKILEFIITGFNKIYNEPYCDEDLKVKLKLANLEMELENKILEKITDKIKNN